MVVEGDVGDDGVVQVSCAFDRNRSACYNAPEISIAADGLRQKTQCRHRKGMMEKITIYREN